MCVYNDKITFAFLDSWERNKQYYISGYFLFLVSETSVDIGFRHGIEQEYTLLQKDAKWPVGWPVGGFPGPLVSHPAAI